MIQKKKNLLIYIFIILFFFIMIEISAQESSIPGKLIVKFEPGVILLKESQISTLVNSISVPDINIRSILHNIGTTQIQKLFPYTVPGQTRILSPITNKIVPIQDLSQVFTIQFSEQVSVNSVISNLAAFPEVHYAEPVFEAIEDAIPNDPYYSEQWYLNNSVNSSFDIDAESAWNYEKGDDIIVALIENGIDTNHPDLDGHIWTSGGSEYGYGSSHGTYVAGIIAAQTDNDTGVVGIGWNCYLMPRRGYDPADRASDIYSAALNGADVINNSWHTPSNMGDPLYLHEAVRNAFNLGAVLVASMGNDQEPRPYTCYPAAYDSFVIAVGALKKVNGGDSLYARSDMNYGSFIDATAPGDSLRTTSIYGSGYGLFGMTSASTPVVSGIVALVRARFPSKSNAEIMDIIRQSSVLFDGWQSDFDHYGHGMVNAYYAVAPPEIPQNFNGTWYNNHPKIYWTANTEPDLEGYEVWKRRDGVWTLRTTTSNINYVDYSEDKWTKPWGMETIDYKIRAVDISDSKSGYTLTESFIVNNKEFDKEIEIPVVEIDPIPTKFCLHSAFPNPFNAITTLKLDLPEQTRFSLLIFDINGKEIWKLNNRKSNIYRAGYHTIRWNGRTNSNSVVPSGVYFIVFNSSDHKIKQKVVLMK